MFTALAIKNFAGSVLSFLWEYKWSILVGAVICFLWIRGNNYQDKYNDEVVAHKQERAEHLATKIENELTLKQIQVDSETALRLAQEEALRDYQSLVEKTNQIQENFNVREKEINSTVTTLNSSNARLSEAIKQYTKQANTNSSTNSSGDKDTTNAERLSTISGLLETCIAEQDYFAVEADKLGNSVITLKQWGDEVVKSVNGVDNNEKSLEK